MESYQKVTHIFENTDANHRLFWNYQLLNNCYLHYGKLSIFRWFQRKQCVKSLRGTILSCLVIFHWIWDHPKFYNIWFSSFFRCTVFSFKPIVFKKTHRSDNIIFFIIKRREKYQKMGELNLLQAACCSCRSNSIHFRMDGRWWTDLIDKYSASEEYCTENRFISI